MTGVILQTVVSAVIGGLVTGVASFAAIRVHLHYLRRDVDNHDTRLTRLETRSA